MGNRQSRIQLPGQPSAIPPAVAAMLAAEQQQQRPVVLGQPIGDPQLLALMAAHILPTIEAPPEEIPEIAINLSIELFARAIAKLPQLEIRAKQLMMERQQQGVSPPG